MAHSGMFARRRIGALGFRSPRPPQIHRDAFSYGAVAETIDTRTIVDLRFFGYATPVKENEIRFETEYEDGYGMPQPTFRFFLSKDDRERAGRMMREYVAQLRLLRV